MHCIIIYRICMYVIENDDKNGRPWTQIHKHNPVYKGGRAARRQVGRAGSDTVGHWHGWDVGREAERKIGGTAERQEAGSQSAGR